MMENEPYSGTSSVSPTTERPPYRPARSKDGCLTCRRRKVRCNEVRPRCSHCLRLHLECQWRSTANTTSTRQTHSPQEVGQRQVGIDQPRQSTSTTTASLVPAVTVDGQFNDVFNYASFMWDGSDIWTGSPGWSGQAAETVPNGQDYLIHQSLPTPIPYQSNNTQQFSSHGSNTSSSYPAARAPEPPVDIQNPNEPLNESLVPAEDRLLTDYFIRTVVPPILAQVETQQKWSSMRQVLMSMFNSSLMVRHAILAFSELLLYRQSASVLTNTHKHYERAVSELSQHSNIPSSYNGGPLREHLLATLFFLSYIDILEGKIDYAHANLKKAYDIFQRADKTRFRPLEVRLLSWIRLLDARAVSAGGEGLFLSDDDESLLAYPSPESTLGNAANGSFQPEGEIEEVLFNVLYQPGFVFFSKVQSFMGRISKIDPWHRSRGTVEDETEVMSIAFKISKDLNTLYDNRPPLMDYAVAGSLTSAHVAESLAVTITRAFRTYLSNYHASKIHLHRVAYKSLPLTSETQNAISTIRHLARLMVEGSESQEMLPVNMLWPLLMWGCEENDPEERNWIKVQIFNMENVATNAKITAHVLEEVQARQDSTKQRVDVRRVMHDIFDSCFAIV